WRILRSLRLQKRTLQHDWSVVEEGHRYAVRRSVSPEQQLLPPPYELHVGSEGIACRVDLDACEVQPPSLGEFLDYVEDGRYGRAIAVHEPLHVHGNLPREGAHREHPH